MTSFLESVARHLITSYGDSVSNHCMVFPGRRAGLYFQKYLAANITAPLWLPRITTINELLRDLSGARLPEPEELLFKLYTVYRRLNSKAEPFDKFYFWGEMILNDFDDMDKYMADASLLFSNIRDLRNIDALFGDLSPEQISVIRQFWINFDPQSMSGQKEEFLNLWSIMPDLYKDFRDEIRSGGKAYEGMVYRDLAERFRSGNLGEIKAERFHFIGFNALSTSEKIILEALKKAGKASFYWDYDISFTDDKRKHSAGFFLKSNIKRFGNDMPEDWSFSTLASSPEPGTVRRIIETSSDISQVKMLPGLLRSIPGLNGPDAHHTAIVLADENLLAPVLSTIPDEISDINVTMGYPVRSGNVYNLISLVLRMHAGRVSENGELYFGRAEVLNLLSNGIAETLIERPDELLSLINESGSERIKGEKLSNGYFRSLFFNSSNSPSDFAGILKKILASLYIFKDKTDNTGSEDKNQDYSLYPGMRNEMIYRIIMAVNRLVAIILRSEIEISLPSFFRLIDKVLRSLSVPFSGEPLSGLQVMGILETRCLDFSNLIILSVNEGILPRNSSPQSFIPYSLREAFGLPTVKHQDSIYSYYFHRLLQRCNNITFLYNSYSDGSKTGEISRFLLQMKYLMKQAPSHDPVSYYFNVRDQIPDYFERTETIQENIVNLLTGPNARPLSPSALNTWLNCKTKFFYRYVCSLKEPEQTPEDLDPAIFGNILHEVMRIIYSPVKGLTLTPDALTRSVLTREKSEKLICEIINRKTGRMDPSAEAHPGIVDHLVRSYVNTITKYDLSLPLLTIEDLEKEVKVAVNVNYGGAERKVFLGGVIDRVDRLGKKVRIVDYKTGYTSEAIESPASLFDSENRDRSDAWFQILTYCEIYSLVFNNDDVIPVLYSIRNMVRKDFTGNLRIKSEDGNMNDPLSYSRLRPQFSAGLKAVIESVLDMANPVTRTSDRQRCVYCPYKELCGR